jgi:hypothetical protein
MASPLPYTVYQVEKDRGNTYDVFYYDYEGGREKFSVIAKDELDAYTQGQQALEKKKARMKTLIICATLSLVAILTSAVGGCAVQRHYYSATMTTCVAAGKSYVSEDGGYSCRDVIVRRKTSG